MLKLTYSDNKLSLDCLKKSLEDWINTRVLISIRSANSIYIQSTTASILLPADSSSIAELEKLNHTNIVEFCRCDAESIEVVFQGIWLTSEANSEIGVFVTELGEYTEYLLQNSFEEALFCHA